MSSEYLRWELAQMEASPATELRRIRSTELTDDPKQAAAQRNSLAEGYRAARSLPAHTSGIPS
jgi:hypothetical protein